MLSADHDVYMFNLVFMYSSDIIGLTIDVHDPIFWKVSGAKNWDVWRPWHLLRPNIGG